MKYIYKTTLAIVMAATLASCVDDEKLEFDVTKPVSIEEMEYLNEYDALKTYVDRSENPDFKLGSGVSVSDYNAKGQMYRLINANFDEVTAGWAMKHGAVVEADGSLNLGLVESFISTAQEAGVTVYGHTLAWHANQNAEYLNKTIEPTIIPGVAGDGGYCLVLKNTEAKENNWESQTWYEFPEPLTEGVQYTFTCMVKATEDYNATIFLQSSTGGDQNYPGGFDITKEWTEVSLTFSPGHNQIDKFTFNFGNFVGEIFVDDVKLVAEGSTDNLIPNPDFETGDISGWTGWTPGAFESISENGQGFSSGGSGGGQCLVLQNTEAKENNWESQTWYQFPEPLTEGLQYTFTCMIKATEDYNATIFLQSSTGGDQNYPGGFNITKEWTEVSLTFSPGHNQIDKFTFNFGNFVGEIFVDNVELVAEGSTDNLIPNADFESGDITGWTGWTPGAFEKVSEVGEGYDPNAGGDQIIEKTPQEKKDTIAYELERWISGMMEVSKEYVKAWDVVNEPMDDGNPSELKSGIGKTDMAEDEFYWQDYLGKDYAVLAFNLAREYGNEDDILFINDYNLEYNLDKCRGLIEYVEYIESQGAEVDGIGTQMHISIDSDKEKISAMFELLAATGKLIKISELDVGVGVKTTEATDEHYQAQAEMYKYVVEKYMEIIPAGQRYGITIWSPTDSPEGSSWRAGEPIGLWTEGGFLRKPAYAAVADGL